MFKAFQRQLEETQQRLNDNMHQPIRKEQKISDFTSPHFSNQQSISASNVPKQKMVNQLQSSSSNIKPSGADSRKRTVITGRDRANQVSPTLSGHLVATSMKSVSDQAQPTTSNKIGPASDRLPATRSGVKSERFTDQIEDDTMPRKKYSLEHGLGDPWKTPLIYPKTGKRRETVQFDDLFRLDEDEFLNDNLIGFFLRYLEYHLELTNPALAKRVYFYNSYFFERLMQTSRGKKGINYESVQKWTRNVDIFTHDFIVVPVNESFHWYVVIICNLSKVRPVDDNEEEDVESERVSSKDPAIVPDKEETRTILVPEEVQDQPTAKTTESLSHLSLSDNDKQLDELALSTKPLSSPRPSSTPKKTSTGRRKSARHSLPKRDVSAPMIITFDSLGAPRSSTCTALRQYIVEEAKSKKGWDIDGRLIKGMTAKGIPTQPNFSDCGLYLCAYMEKFILDPANFIGKILQREMDAEKDMPLLPSEALRSRMRGMIQELHNRQESEETEMPIPEVGRILLSEISPASPGGNSEPRTPLREDSEDELQQDHAKFEIFDAERAHSDAIMRKDKHEQTTPRSTMSSDEKPLLSKTAMTVNEILAKIDGSPSGTREAAITIDEDEDIQPVPKNVATKRSPAKDDFFDHPSELNAPMSAHKASPTPRKPSKATITQQMQRQRGRPRASLDTTTQKGKGASEKHTHRWSRSRSRATSADSTDTTYLKSGKSYERHDDREAKKPEIVVVVPDSQGSEEVEAETKRNGNGNEELHQEQDQEILDGV